MMYKIKLFVLTIALSFIFENANGQSICSSIQISTGYVGTSPISDGVSDFNWEIISSPYSSNLPFGTYPIVASDNFAQSKNWESLQIDVDNDGTSSEGLYVVPATGSALFEGDYEYKTTFCLSDDATNCSINWKLLADVSGSIELNGASIGTGSSTINSPNGYVYGNEAIGSNSSPSIFIIGGVNEIVVTVNNNDHPGFSAFFEIFVESGCVTLGDECVSCQPELSLTNLDQEKYWLSAWVHVANPNQVKSFASDSPSDPPLEANIELEFVGSASNSTILNPSGEIIDGWQRVVGSFTIPANTTELNLILNADVNYDTNFDDIRLHPFNASMKSYVYDGETFWLTSELDDNNYATFYEYDNEGGLIRIKKETSRGIVTIQETRSSSPDNNDD